MKDETKLNLGKLCESGGTGEYGESSGSGDSGEPGESRLSCSGSRRVMGGWNVDSGCHKISENVSIVWSKTSYSGDKRRCHYAGRTTTKVVSFYCIFSSLQCYVCIRYIKYVSKAIYNVLFVSSRYNMYPQQFAM